MGEGRGSWHSHTAVVAFKSREENIQLIREGGADCRWWTAVLFVVGNCTDPLPHAVAVIVVKMLFNLHFIFPFDSSNPSSQICS